MAAASGSSAPGPESPPADPLLAAAKARARDAAQARLRALTPEAMADESAAVARRVAASRPFRSAQAVGLYATCARLREVDASALLDAALGQGKRVHLPLVLDRAGGMALLHVPLGRRDLRPGAPPFGIDEPRSRGYLVPPPPLAAPACGKALLPGAASGGGVPGGVASDEGVGKEWVEGPEPRANALPELAGPGAPAPAPAPAAAEVAAGAAASAAAAAPVPAPLAPLDLLVVPGLAFDRSGRRLGRGGGYYDRAIAALRAAWPEPPLLVGLAFRAQVVEAAATEAAAAAASGDGEGEREARDEAGGPPPPILPADDVSDARVDVLATADGLVACSERGRAALGGGEEDGR